MLELTPHLIIFITSMMPFAELRVAILMGLLYYNLPLWQVFSISVLGNILPVPFIILFFSYIEILLRRYKRWDRVLTRLFDRTRRRANPKIQKYKTLGLIAFVAIPLPFTGAWTGSLIAYLFGLKLTKAILTISIGVIIGGLFVTLLCLTGTVWLTS
ncbi:MAG: small multi-drug export protein [Candidatus Thermoplasmatota archaeon]|nr:small multi-drug export protein [Candidatus Thermoplasmatota archaeon]